MEEKIRILDCSCGSKGAIYTDEENVRQTYYIKCQCGRKSYRYCHIEDAIKDWNMKNKPVQASVKNVCGFCGEEVFQGFKKCPKCGAILEW